MVTNHNVVTAIVNADSMEELKEMGDVLLNALPSGIGVLGTDAGDKPYAVIVVTNDLTKKGIKACLLYTSPSPRDGLLSRMPSSA